MRCLLQAHNVVVFARFERMVAFTLYAAPISTSSMHNDADDFLFRLYCCACGDIAQGKNVTLMVIIQRNTGLIRCVFV